MQFEWDDGKNEANIEKHGFELGQAEPIFDGPIFSFVDLREDYGEVRFVGYGILDGVVVTFVFTQPNSEAIRIISLRKATSNERKHYENYLKSQFG